MKIRNQKRFAILLLCGCIITLFTVGLLDTGDLGFALGRLIGTSIIWTLILGIISSVGGTKRWLMVFALLFFAATLFELFSFGFKQYVSFKYREEIINGLFQEKRLNVK